MPALQARRTLVGIKEVPMRISIAAVAVLTALVIVVPASSERVERPAATATPPVSAFLPSGVFGPRQLVFFGYVKSLTSTNGRYLARIDPSLMLTGITASAAGVEDGKLRPGEGVPNDYYERNETKRLLTYRVPADALVRVIVNPGTGPRPVVVPVSELVQIVKGKNPKNRPGLWPVAAGFWIRVEGDRALELDMPYRP
jgi:hypothetical protein